MLMAKKNKVFHLTDTMNKQNVKEHLRSLSFYVDNNAHYFHKHSIQVSDTILKIIDNKDKESEDVKSILNTIRTFEYDFDIQSNKDFDVVYQNKNYLNLILNHLEFIATNEPFDIYEINYRYEDEMIAKPLAFNILNIINEIAEEHHIEKFTISDASYEDSEILFSHPLLDRFNTKLALSIYHHDSKLGIWFEFKLLAPAYSDEFHTYFSQLKTSKKTIKNKIIPTLGNILDTFVFTYDSYLTDKKIEFHSDKDRRYPELVHSLEYSNDTELDAIPIVYSKMDTTEMETTDFYEEIRKNLLESFLYLKSDMQFLNNCYTNYFYEINGLINKLPVAEKNIFLYEDNMTDYMDVIIPKFKNFSDTTRAYLYDILLDNALELEEGHDENMIDNVEEDDDIDLDNEIHNINHSEEEVEDTSHINLENKQNNIFSNISSFFNKLFQTSK